MGIFSCKNDDSPEPDTRMTELGRDYAIARRHRDRAAMNRIMREIGTDKDVTDLSDFRAGQESYDSIPPIPRRRNRRK
ncbi:MULTISPECIES: hypothetical protein [Streptomyces]|uniref:Uncharacterized protein n=1 Tax=Streptomyces doudnae TaxID=3075536 RepID=A0ABD5EQF1_9ACTN|nr:MULTISPECIES: hypothetical protein [unclassified Streptomyces]MDT0436916.1 hypothetical protein [Streptomyces sp. DSM 41981]MYQ63054.1 hypothetical protein [Streptomyces sp. SID4950]SCD49888.1 hypothetical protein GA0115242_10663 [Streptomyces sp. SolWspMP-5a-2]